ncbi:MAG: septum formation initiator family protein [Spirochaetota bacterium]
MRRGTRLFFSIYAGFLVYSLLIFVGGNTGILAMKKILQNRAEIQNNIEELEKINRQLASRLESLRSDTRLLKLYARELGYFDKNEKIVKISGYRSQGSFYAVGRLLKEEAENPSLKPAFRSIAVAVGITFFILSGLIKKDRNGNQKK